MSEVSSWIRQHAVRTPDAHALIDTATGATVTYAELWARVRAVAHGLQERHSVSHGDRVAILSRNDVRVIEVLYACALLGAIAVPLNWRLAPTELVDIVKDAEPTALLAEDWAADLARRVAPQPTDVRYEGLNEEPPHNAAQHDSPSPASPTLVLWSSERSSTDDYEQLASAKPPADWVHPTVDEDDVWTIIYTSGTTGRPKGVQATHRAVLASMLGILVAHHISATSRSLTVLPTFHVAGLNLFTNPTLYAGGTVLVARSFEPQEALHLLRDADPAVTHFCGVPANYQFIEQLTEFEERPLRPFVAVVGGSPVPASLLRSWRQRGVPLSAVFGITEAGACVTAVPANNEATVAGLVGLPVLTARCRIRDTEGNDVAVGQVGELQVGGPVLTTGYWRNQKDTGAAFTDDGWLRTGDAAAMRDDGQVILVDRWKDMYISGGENVYPAEVENVLNAHPDVAQVAVVGTPDPRWGEVGLAYVMRAGEAVCAADQLIEWCAGRLARFKVPAQIVFVDDLPRNATGKTLKGELRERATADRTAPL